MSRSALFLPVLVAGLAVASCGGDDTTKGTTVKADLVVAADHIAWDKPAYAVTATDGKVIIELKNEDLVEHNLHVVAADGTDNATVISTNPSATKTATYTLAAGTYTLICTIAGHSNMKATLTVS